MNLCLAANYFMQLSKKAILSYVHRNVRTLAAMPCRVCWLMVQTVRRGCAVRTVSSRHMAPHVVRQRESVTSHNTAVERMPSALLMCTSRMATAATITSLTVFLGSVGAMMNSVTITGDQACCCYAMQHWKHFVSHLLHVAWLGSSMAVEECYDTYNIGNNLFSNCGYSNGATVACAPEDVLCGQLQCSSGTYQSQVNIGVYLLTGSVNVDGRNENCLSFSPLSPPADFIHPGLVEDGTKCGDGKV